MLLLFVVQHYVYTIITWQCNPISTWRHVFGGRDYSQSCNWERAVYNAAAVQKIPFYIAVLFFIVSELYTFFITDESESDESTDYALFIEHIFLFISRESYYFVSSAFPDVVKLSLEIICGSWSRHSIVRNFLHGLVAICGEKAVDMFV